MIVRKKPIEFEAYEYDGSPYIYQFPDLKIISGFGKDGKKLHYFIKTLEGVMEIEIGDIVIKGIEGEYYAVKPGIFHKTYDVINGG